MISRLKIRQDKWIIVAIILLPLLTYLYLLFPPRETVQILGYQFDSKYYNDVEVFVYIVMQKLVFILIFFVWFLTCKNWWRNILCVPMIFFLSQFIIALNADLLFLDQNEVVFSFIISLPIVLTFILFFNKFQKYYTFISLNENLGREIDVLLNDVSALDIERLEKVSQKLESLRKSKEKMSDEEYLKGLIALQHQLLDLKSV